MSPQLTPDRQQQQPDKQQQAVGNPVRLFPDADQGGEYEQSHRGEQHAGCYPSLPGVQVAQRRGDQQAQRPDLQFRVARIQVHPAGAGRRAGQQLGPEGEVVPGVATGGGVHKAPQHGPGRQHRPDKAAAQSRLVPTATYCPGLYRPADRQGC